MLPAALILLMLLAADPTGPADTQPFTAQPVDVVGLDVDELRQAEQGAQLELSLQQIRLGLLKAWARVAESKYAEAGEAARETLALVEELPEGVDREPLVKSLERVLQHAEQGAQAGTSSGEKGTTSKQAAPASKARGSSRYAAHPKLDLVTSDASDLSLASAAYPPKATDLEPHADPFLAEALERCGEAPLLLEQLMTYPSNWQALTERRAQFQDGTIYKGPRFRAADGELKQTIIYDVQTLLMGPARFPHAPQLDQLILSVDGMGRVMTPYVVTAPYAAAYGYGVQTIPMPAFPCPPAQANAPTPQELADQRLAELERLVQEFVEEK